MHQQAKTTGYLRASQIVPAIVPVSKSTFWKYVSEGAFPAPLKLSRRVTVWRIEDVQEWMDKHNKNQIKVVN